MAVDFRYQVNVEHIRQSGPDYGLGVEMPLTPAVKAVCVITGLVPPHRFLTL